MGIITYVRRSTLEEMSKELDRRGAVIERLEPELFRLRTLADQMAEALRPFAAMQPSSLYAANGSEAEPYQIEIALAHPVDFTGSDLAKARATFEAYERMK